MTTESKSTQELTDLIQAAREAAAVRRCHVVPHHGEYTNGYHSHNALSLLFILHPDPSMDLVKALHSHDYGERWVGDMPAPAKWYDPALGEAYGRAEQGALQTWGFYWGWEGMSSDDYDWLNALDRLELWFWCQDQMAMGNKHVTNVLYHLNRSFKQLDRVGRLPRPVRDVINFYQWRRMPEMPEVEKQAAD